ncbi:response regulator [Tepidiforma sp.]|jgi:CheY-like chemotaxis protein|uniref:response regulator n=1 Tax=Tepidiforma sp. TaxID=2682230 RepID=UPI0021DCFC11|nr:response regulator [Tepidiforma sp.]MCX7617962.1 response regulator [Tepidiforma sp.]GIW19056.1 MAG: hypothetical protein KatS3mg064_2213 [Tepidiforma sp.]
MSSPRPGPPAAPEEPPGRRGTILIVDGDAAVRRVLRLVLEGEGWRAITAPDARRALALVDDDPPDVVLLEVALADQPGTEVAAALAQRQPRPRIVLMSAYPRPFAGPEDAFLAKPLFIGRLVRLLESLEG